MKKGINKISLKVILSVTILALGASFYLTFAVLPEIQSSYMLFTAFLIDLSFYLVVLLVVRQQLKKADVSFSSLLGKTNLEVKKIIPAASLVLLHFCVMILGIFFVVRLMLSTQVGSAISMELLMESPSPSQLSPLASLLKFFIAVIIGPIAEEVLFRGIILNKWAERFGVNKGILFSSILFMIFHINSFFIPQLIAGILLGIIYIKTKQLIYPILAHSLNNLIPFLLIFIPESDSPELNVDMGELISALNIFSVVFLIVMFIFIIAMLRYAKQIKKEVIPYHFNSRIFD